MDKIRALYNETVMKMEFFLQSPFLLFLRIWVGWVFFKSGMTKWSSWDSTLYLFEEEYKVPLLSPEIAAYLGTAAELILPVFLVLGLGTRLFGSMLFLFNIVAVASYPVLTQNGFSLFSLGAMDHQIWGLMLLTVVLFGAGRFSVDALLKLR